MKTCTVCQLQSLREITLGKYRCYICNNLVFTSEYDRVKDVMIRNVIASQASPLDLPDFEDLVYMTDREMEDL